MLSLYLCVCVCVYVCVCVCVCVAWTNILRTNGSGTCRVCHTCPRVCVCVRVRARARARTRVRARRLARLCARGRVAVCARTHTDVGGCAGASQGAYSRVREYALQASSVSFITQ